jgi:hypothetical protein
MGAAAEEESCGEGGGWPEETGGRRQEGEVGRQETGDRR